MWPGPYQRSANATRPGDNTTPQIINDRGSKVIPGPATAALASRTTSKVTAIWLQ
jgi:hypothetical protein